MSCACWRYGLSLLALLSLVLASLVFAERLQAQAVTAPGRDERVIPRTEAATTKRGSPDTAHLEKIEPSLLKQLLQARSGEQIRFIAELAPLALPSATLDSVPLAERRHLVVERLQSTTAQSQAGLLAFLQEGQEEGRVTRIRPFWILNGVAVRADADALLAIAARPEVRIIRQDSWRQWVEPFAAQMRQPVTDGVDLEWNIARIRADLAWRALGLDGSGVTIATIDTGVDWQHPALKAQYRGYKAKGLPLHDGNWFCATDEGYLYPYDGHGHGTHVTGTTVGGMDPAGNAFGVAPGARWIAVKAFDDRGYTYDSWLHAAFEWILAPDGDPGRAPDIVNASWGSRNAQDEALRPDVQALRMAGIMLIASAGNDGPHASTIHSPASYPEAIAVGSSDDIDEIAGFSSRGPSPWGETKPQVVAPGTQIWSTLPGGSYGIGSGTSMSAPHVSGLVALMLQADPTLTVASIEAILGTTAEPLSESVPNNDAGWGRVDAYRAAATAMEAGVVTGQITRHPDLQPLPHAQIRLTNDLGEPWVIVQVDEAGWYTAALPAGRYSLTAQAFGYMPNTVPNVNVQAGVTTTLGVTLLPAPSGVLWGQLTHAETGGPVAAEIAIPGTPARTASNPQTGQYSLTLPAGVYTVEMVQNGYRRHTVSTVEIVADRATRLDAALVPAQTLLLVDSGPWYYGSQADQFTQALNDSNYVYDLWEIRDLSTGLPEVDDLEGYDITIWSSPQDAPGLIGAGDTISNYLSTGGNLFLTGQDVGFWDDGLSALYYHPYYGQWLGAQAVADDAGRGNVEGLQTEILEGLSLPMNGPDSAANQISPDSISLLDPRNAAIIGRYADDGEAAIRASGCQSYRAVYLAAGLEGLGDRAERAEVMERTLTWLGSPHPEVAVELYPPQQEQVWLTGTFITYTVELQNLGAATNQFSLELSPSAWPSSIWDDTFTHAITQSMALGACQTQTLRLKVTVPPDVAWNMTDVVTLTARSQVDTVHTAQAVFASKAPAPILLVDDHRWYDTSGSYQSALDASDLPYDLWTRDPPIYPDRYSPSLQRLQRYPIVIWYTAYDWHETLTPTEEDRLATYLENGGRLLFSSQDYLYTSGFTDFATDFLGMLNYTDGLTTTQTAGAVGSPIADELGPFELFYPFRNWSDALRPTPAARVAFWGQHAQPAALTLDDTPWKTAFFAFPLESLQEQDMATVMGRTVQWLSPLGDSTLAVDRPVATAGDELTYTLSIQNTGPELLEQVSLSNTVPPSTTYIADSLQGPADADYDPLTNRFIWDGPLASGQAISVSYRLQLHSPLRAGTVIRNYAHLTEESGLAVDRLATTRINVPDLSASAKTASAREASPNQVLTYTLTLRNDGLQPAQAHLTDPIPLYTMYEPGSATASSGQLTSTLDALQWTGTIPTGHEVTITFPAVISPTTVGLYVLNRATLTDGWGETQSLEAYTWVEMRIFLPLVLKQH